MTRKRRERKKRRPEPADKLLLDRHCAPKEVSEHYGESIDFIRDVVSYGSVTVTRILSSESNVSIEKDIVVGVLLKHSLQMLDAIEVLTRQGCVLASTIEARSLFEAWLSARWILDAETQKRARTYYVSCLRQDRVLQRRAVPGTQEHRHELDANQKTFGEGAPQYSAEEVENSKRRIAKIDNHLKEDPLQAIDKIFEERLQQKSSRGFEPTHWFEVLGINSIRHLASELDSDAQYRTYYRKWSQTAHAPSHHDHVRVGPAGAVMTPIRWMGDMWEALTIPAIMTTSVIALCVERFMPEEYQAFGLKHFNDWRPRRDRIPSIPVDLVGRRGS